MAKAAAKTKKKKDYLRATLKELAKLDACCAEAIKMLCKGTELPVDKVPLVKKRLKVGGTTYTFRLTRLQWTAITSVADQGATAVLLMVRDLLSQLTVPVCNIEPILFNYLTTGAKPTLPTPGPLVGGVGCCTFSVGSPESLTQAQCTKAGGTGWTHLPCDQKP